MSLPCLQDVPHVLFVQSHACHEVVRHYLKSKQKANLAIFTENLNAKLKHSIQILAYRGIA